MLLITRSFKSCGINNALDGTENDLVWDDDEEEEAEDEEEPIDNEFETDSSAELSHNRFFSEPTNQIKSMINVVCLLFIHLPVFIYIFISV